MLPRLVEENYTSNSSALESHEDGTSEKVEISNSISGDVQYVRAADDSDGAENAIESSNSSFLFNIETDPNIWAPPEPEDMEDDMDSVANNDDDDDYDDGTKWGQSSSLNSLDGECGSCHSYKEERQKAMLEAMNGQFKILVSRLLASEGMPSYEREGGENWLDIVTTLSWEAALLIKPDVNEGRAMDPGSYIKVKCIACGSRSQSQVIKGLVFKKNTAHKHMPTKFRNPRLLLLQGSLGHSAVGLSSLKSMDQEKDYLKSITDMIETCHPNVILVEKTVSRDIQESLLAKGITLVFDMKLPRLVRIARCTGSQIISSADILVRPKLKQCDSFHIEKFVEEHNGSGEGGKRPSKTLMFLEGCPKPLGCTILLKGAHSDELKKVKRVVHYTVFAAYHLILETSFFSDQRALFSDVNAVRELNGPFTDKSVPSVSCDAAPISDIPISDGSLERSVHDGMQFKSDLDAGGSSPVVPSAEDNIMHRDLFCDEPRSNEILQSDSLVKPLLPGQLLSSVSSSLKKFLVDGLPPITSASISSYFGFSDKVVCSQSTGALVSPSLETFEHGKDANGKINQENPDDGIANGEKAGLTLDPTETIEGSSDGITVEVQMQSKDDIESTLDPESILVLFSSQCITRQMVCEQSHLSRIKYYGNFDVSIGRYLQDTLLNQKHSCSSCGEPPEAHVYRYTHQNGNLTVIVRPLPRGSILSGGAEGKIWMWTRCLKCKHESGIPRSTQRVVMSPSACGLSFGKFLELSFSSHSAANRLSRCGHSLHRDCLRFFGLGSKVAMFRYSSVEIYDVCKPSPILEFYNPNGQEWLAREARDVLAKGDLFFMEVANLLQKLKPRCSSVLSKHDMKIFGLVKKIDEVEEMLMQEKSEFEASLLKAINCSGRMGKIGHGILDLNWRLKELLLMLYVWDHRLHFIMLCTRDSDTTNDAIYEERSQKENGVMSSNKYVEGNITENGDTVLGGRIQIPINLESSSSSGSHHAQDHTIVETELEIESGKISGHTAELGCLIEENSTESMNGKHPEAVLNQDSNTKPPDHSSFLSDKDCEEESIPILDDVQEDHSIPVTVAPLDYEEKVTDSELKTDETLYGGEMGVHVSQKSQPYKLEDPKGWIWDPFSELRKAYRKDLHGGFLQKFEFINTYAPTYLSSMRQLINLEMDSLHFPVGPGGDVISVIEDEISSIIACALALSEDQHGLSGKVNEEESKGVDNSQNQPSNGFGDSSHWLSTGSLESEGKRPSQSVSSFLSDELSILGSDGSLFVDWQIAPENLHPEVPVGSGRVAGKSKYSVVCIYVKQFYSLRRRCCPSEHAYISSLTRCKKWDAQGGKSKAFFAKSMDDRFIIKQIKKPELESFLKFGPDYFKHISLSLDSGSQTCLAKILGIYQVRQYKSGKEVKTDLVVMENIFFGRNISRKYDLKGAVLSRYIPDSNDPERVLLDENFVEDMRVSPIYVGGKTKHLLQRAIWNDTSFLTSINVMDYSLLVGVDKQRHEIVFGIIDYLRQYTWDKQLETWVKASLVVPKNALPTVVSPKEYKKRFRKFMTKYFLTVPDSWTSEHCSGSCKFCIDGSNNSSKLHTGKLSEQ